VAKASRLEYSDVEAVIGTGTQDVDWVLQEFAGMNLSDKRLDRRLIKTAEHLARSPLSPINEACGDWASTQAAYRLFDNPKASPEAILEPHIRQTLKRLIAHSGPVLVVQDTVFLSYGTHPKTRGLGPIGTSNSAEDRGLIMHNALAFTSSGVPLGLLSQRIWARQEVPKEGHVEKIVRLQHTAIEEKESSKWLLALRETQERVPRKVNLVTVADRESDFFEFITQAQEHRARFLVRACRDRHLVPEDSEGYASMLEAVAGTPVLGTLAVEIPSNGRRKARIANVQIRVAQVTIKPPKRCGNAKESCSTEPVSVTLVAAAEKFPPAGIESLSWVLLTNLPVKDFAAAVEKVQWYGQRWGIETWHKVLKSGCKVEECLLQTAERLQRYLTLFSIIGIRLMRVAHLARIRPEAPATAMFSAEEVEALHIRINQTLPPPDPPTLREAVRMIGRLGGHLGRKCDGEPGLTVLWRGWMRLYEDVEILRAHKQALGLINSS
jgi:Transposase DNA-binding/Transposase Tn5 dimerisation domain